MELPSATGIETGMIAGSDAPGECLRAPVDGSLLTRFVEPSCPYCAGRRTLGFAAEAGDIVRSPIDGRVHFTGSVVGSGYLTLVPALDSSFLVTVGGVDASPRATDPARPIGEGAVLREGEVIGTATGPVGLSLRRRPPSGAPVYLDPEPFLARWRVRARLVPVSDGVGRNAAARFGCRRVLGGGASGSPSR